MISSSKVFHDERMIILRSQIGDVLSEIYLQMPLEQARDFEAYRKMLYSQFEINSEHFRRKCRLQINLRSLLPNLGHV